MAARQRHASAGRSRVRGDWRALGGGAAMPDPVLAALAAIAREEYTRRRDRAVAKVASGDLRAGEANGLLLPWLAIACRCGSAVPELAEPLAQVRSIPGSRE